MRAPFQYNDSAVLTEGQTPGDLVVKHHARFRAQPSEVVVVEVNSDASPWLDRKAVTDLRDWLTDWLEETEIKLPTALGSVIYANARTYTLVKRGESDTSYAPRYGKGETVWLNVWNGWDSAESLSRATDLKILFDAGRVDQ